MTASPAGARRAPCSRCWTWARATARRWRPRLRAPACEALRWTSASSWTGAGPLGFAPLQADAARLPFRDRAFTATLSMETLEWFADPPAALREMARVSQDAVVLVQSEWGSLWFDSGDPDTAREFTRLFSGPGAPAGRRLAGLVTGAGMQVASESTDTIRGERLQRGTYAFELLRILREYLVVQRSGVRARRFDEWRDDLVERAARGAFSFSLERHVVVGRPPAS